MELLLIAVLILAMSCACGGNKVKLPIETSLGNLVRIEQKDNVATDERTISPEPGKVLCVLSFEGKSEISYEGGEKDPLQTFPLVDSNGKEFTPLYAASPIAGGKLSNKEWRYDGQLQGTSRGWIFVGVLNFQQPKLTLVYAVPREASGLILKDGERRHPIN